jgi:hypothetical protein
MLQYLLTNPKLHDRAMNNIVSGIFCPSCKMRNEPGVEFCVYCNASLLNEQNQAFNQNKIGGMTGSLQTTSLEDVLDAPMNVVEGFMDFELPEKGIALINLEDGKPIAVVEEKVFLLGRKSPELDTQEQLIDLTPYGAVELGISRLHAMIRQTKAGYKITDLGSSNGTWLENQRLTAKQAYPFAHGDRIRLGRLNMLAFYSNGP